MFERCSYNWRLRNYEEAASDLIVTWLLCTVTVTNAAKILRIMDFVVTSSLVTPDKPSIIVSTGSYNGSQIGNYARFRFLPDHKLSFNQILVEKVLQYFVASLLFHLTDFYIAISKRDRSSDRWWSTSSDVDTGHEACHQVRIVFVVWGIRWDRVGKVVAAEGGDCFCDVSVGWSIVCSRLHLIATVIWTLFIAFIAQNPCSRVN